MLIKTVGFIVVGTITDEDGKFELSYGEKFDCKLSISYLGCEDWSKNIQTDKNVELGTIELIEKISELEEVSITSRRKIITKVGKKLVFNVENSKEVSSLDGLETLKFAPRIDPTSDCPNVFGKDYTLIYINGRPSNQPTANICKYLATLRSDEIKKIEVITTTSAKLDAEGNKAIINIVLKKRTNIGFDGFTSIQYNQRTFPTYWPSSSLTYSSKKLSTSLNASYFDEKQKNDISTDILFNESSRQIETVRKPHIKGFIGSLNLNYEVSPKIDIRTRFSSILNKSDEEARTETFYNNIVNQAIDSTSTLPTRGNLDYEYYALSLYSDFKLDTVGSKLKINANTLKRIQSDNKSLLSTIFSGNTSNVIRSESAFNNSDVDYRVNSIVTDFEISKPKTKWEFGGKVTLINNDSDISFFNTNSGMPILDPNQSNTFLYDETILAAYISKVNTTLLKNKYICIVHIVYILYICKNNKIMRKNIDIKETVLTKLKIISAFEKISVKALMERAVAFFVEHKEKERLNSLSKEEKEDLGLLLLMQQVNRNETVNEEEIMKALD